MTASMPAVGYRKSLPITDDESLVDLELPVPTPGPHDLLVRVEAVSVNPVDVKVRLGTDPGGEPKVLGYDAAGVVEAVGDGVTLFAPGDEVFYAGSVARSGTNARRHLVDERIVGPKPTTLSFADSAALPLTALTAWETLFDRLRLTAGSTGTLLVLAAAGGVGSMVVQLATRLTGVTVIGTASRPASRDWVLGLGAAHVVDHHAGLTTTVPAVAPDGVDFVSAPFSAGNVEAFAEIVRPGGHVVALDEPEGLDLLPLKAKSVAWHWEMVFTRALFEPESTAQHEILTRVAALVDDGTLRTTTTETLGPITAATLREAHAKVESSSTIGKIVLAGWPS